MQHSKYCEPNQIPNLIAMNYLMIDLRKKEDALSHPLPSFVNIPYDQLAKACISFRKDIPIVLMCYHGQLSEYAYQDLTALGFKVMIIQGGYAHYKHPTNMIYF